MKVKTVDNKVTVSINCAPDTNNCYYARGNLGKNNYAFQKFHGYSVDNSKPTIQIHLKGQATEPNSERTKIWAKLHVPAAYSDSNIEETITLLDVISIN